MVSDFRKVQFAHSILGDTILGYGDASDEQVREWILQYGVDRGRLLGINETMVLNFCEPAAEIYISRKRKDRLHEKMQKAPPFENGHFQSLKIIDFLCFKVERNATFAFCIFGANKSLFIAHKIIDFVVS